jgi:manganese transport protein
MIMLTSRRTVMGALVNKSATTAIASLVAGVIIALNLFLLHQQLFG